jgi:unsaturated rhamnogalacturonyl hydrolase
MPGKTIKGTLALMLSAILLFGILYAGCLSSPDPKPEEIVNKVSAHWLDLQNNFEQTQDVWGDYTLDLTLEALLKYDELTGKNYFTEIVKEVFRKRNISAADTISYKTQPFCSINFTLGEQTGNDEWFSGFTAESYRMYLNARKSPEGAVMLNHREGHYILIDYLQEYASRLAKTAHLTGDSKLFEECVNQFILYEKLLRNPKTGLWCQGRGWCEDSMKLSQGAWSRGHGWLMRGLVSSMLYLPEEYRMNLLPVLRRLSFSLLKVQSPEGMFHILLDFPLSESVPDVSGTGMIAYYLAISVQEGWLEEDQFKPAILRATNEMKNYVTEKREVLNSSKGPGPLCSPEEYLNYQPEVDEKHGFQGMIYGMMGEIVASSRR